MDFQNYYNKQARENLPAFRGATFQRGYGIGSVFTRFFKWFAPIFNQSVPFIKNVGKEALKGAVKVANETINDGKDLAQSVKAQLKTSLNNVADQVGSGRKKKVYKKLKKSKSKHSENSKNKKITKKRKLDIFD
jgi:hypothetical protein